MEQKACTIQFYCYVYCVIWQASSLCFYSECISYNAQVCQYIFRFSKNIIIFVSVICFPNILQEYAEHLFLILSSASTQGLIITCSEARPCSVGKIRAWKLDAVFRPDFPAFFMKFCLPCLDFLLFKLGSASTSCPLFAPSGKT